MDLTANKVTMQMIADLAGVSKYVVSKVINGKPGVSEATRSKVLHIAKQLGYLIESPQTSDHPNKSTQVAPSSSQSYVMVVITNKEYKTQEKHYWHDIMDGIIEQLKECNKQVIIITENTDFGSIVDLSQLFGIITVGNISTEILTALHKLPAPVVMVDHEDPLFPVDRLFMDNFGGIYKMTNHLIALGHKRLMFVGGIRFARSFHERWLGFRSAIEEHSLPSDPERILFSYEEQLEQRFESWLKYCKKQGLPLPTAFVCANDDIAIKIMKILQNAGYNIPGDCSVTGFDNLPESAHVSPPLTTVQVLRKMLGRRAVSKLIWRKKHPEYLPEKLLICGEIIHRDSVATPKPTF